MCSLISHSSSELFEARLKLFSFVLYVMIELVQSSPSLSVKLIVTEAGPVGTRYKWTIMAEPGN